jgi:type II secretory pathway component PulK
MRTQRGSVLIIVLWVSFGLVSLALYFAQSMSFEMRAADQRAAAIEAEQAIAGAARYITNILGRLTEPGQVPLLTSYRSEAVPVGDATFWLIGRSDTQTSTDVPAFGLKDEAAKLDLNTATLEMLEALPRMTPELAAAIIDWRDSNDEVTEGGAESTTYLRLNPPYQCKNTNFESVAELRLVTGAFLDILFGEDANRNGILDLNENDGDASTPSDNRDGRLDAGLFEYVTVYTRQAMTGTNVSNRQQLQSLLTDKLGNARANQVLTTLTNLPAPLAASATNSVLGFYLASGLTREEFIPIEGSLVSPNPTGLVNVNTASEAVLACLPGIGTSNASKVVAYRRTNANQDNSVAWVADAIDRPAARQAARWLTGRTYQFTADIAATGHHGRGYRRVQMVFDTSSGAPVIRYRQDLTHLGWALGRRVRETLQLAKEIR